MIEAERLLSRSAFCFATAKQHIPAAKRLSPAEAAAYIIMYKARSGVAKTVSKRFLIFGKRLKPCAFCRYKRQERQEMSDRRASDVKLSGAETVIKAYENQPHRTTK